MRIQKSNVVLDEDFKNVLVKEYAVNYKELSVLVRPDDIV